MEDGAAEGVPPPRSAAALGALKVSALRKLAIGAGAPESDLEAADDADDTKAALIALILAATPTAEVQLRRELGALPKSALRKRAVAEGACGAALDEADDADDTKAALIELIIALSPDGDRVSARREELAALKKSALRKRAVAAGVAGVALEQADDADDSKAALIELLLLEEAERSGTGAEPAGAESRREDDAPPDQGSLPLQGQPLPVARSGPLNEPGHWDAMISYTQRNPTSETLAVKLSGELQKRGLGVWLDVDMPKRDEAAMQEGAQKSKCIIAIVSGPPSTENAYFRRTFCVSELRWAHEASVRVVPVVAAEDKGMITEFFADIPEDLAHLKSANWEHIDRKDADYFGLGVDKILRAAQLLLSTGPEPEHEHVVSAELRRIHSGDSNGGAGKTDPARTVFGSMRFPVPLEAMLLQAALKQLGVTLTIIAMRAGQDISKEVFAAIEHAETFL
eukprot:COSAG01_NODE_11820_length_1853_cov_2.289624_1_plen_455_part_01